MNAPAIDDPLSLTFGALADPTRRAILARLAEGEATVNELAAPFELKLPTVSKHLKVLMRAGLVSQGRKAQWRPCRLEPAPIHEVAEWAERFRANWEQRFEQLDAYLAAMPSSEESASSRAPRRAKRSTRPSPAASQPRKKGRNR